MPPPDILILLVNYNDEAATCAFVREQVPKGFPEGAAVVIVNNGSRNGEALYQLAREVPGVRVVEAHENIGYLPGAALGLRTWLEESHGWPAAVILSNTDMVFPGPLFPVPYLSDERRQFDLIGPDIVSARFHHPQNPFLPDRISRRRLRTLHCLSSCLLLHWLFLAVYFGRSWMLAPFRKNPSQPGRILPAYAIHGSFMIFHRSFFDKGGSLDYPNVLYGEEIWLGEQARRLGLRSGFDPSLQVIHREHGSTGLFKSRKLMRLMHRSYGYLLRHYDDP